MEEDWMEEDWMEPGGNAGRGGCDDDVKDLLGLLGEAFGLKKGGVLGIPRITLALRGSGGYAYLLVDGYYRFLGMYAQPSRRGNAELWEDATRGGTVVLVPPNGKGYPRCFLDGPSAVVGKVPPFSSLAELRMKLELAGLLRGREAADGV